MENDGVLLANPDEIIDFYGKKTDIITLITSFIGDNLDYSKCKDPTLEDIKKFQNDTSITEFSNKIRNNFFYIIDKANDEIKHSAVIKWLLDPSSGHEMKYSFLNELFGEAISILKDNAELLSRVNKISEFLNNSRSDINIDDFYVKKENILNIKNNRADRIDISLIFRPKNEMLSFFVGIENKIKSKENKTQSAGQAESSRQKYKNIEGNRFIYFYLSRDSNPVLSSKEYIPITYVNIANALDRLRPENAFTKSVIQSLADSIKYYMNPGPSIVQMLKEFLDNHRNIIQPPNAILYDNFKEYTKSKKYLIEGRRKKSVAFSKKEWNKCVYYELLDFNFKEKSVKILITSDKKLKHNREKVFLAFQKVLNENKIMIRLSEGKETPASNNKEVYKHETFVRDVIYFKNWTDLLNQITDFIQKTEAYLTLAINSTILKS